MNRPDELDLFLRQWRIEPRPTDDFALGVWRKIEERRAHPIRWAIAAIRAWLEVDLPRPLPAALLVTAVAMIAFVSATAAGSIHRHLSAQSAAERYLTSIDPVSRVARLAHRP